MARYYFDISDVVQYFAYNASASGIQRVQLEFIVENAGLQGFILVDKALLGQLVTLVDGIVPTRKQLATLIAEIRASTARAIPEQGDIFFVSGAFWISSSTSRSWLNAKAQGAIVGFLCYDLIPVTHPEFCDEGLVDAFSYAIDSVFHVTDFIFTISEHVKTEVERHLRSMNLDVPVIALPLAHELAPTKGEPSIRKAVRELTQKRYVLFVSTIEARKNHAYTMTLWQRLLAKLPADQVPELVWVGRPGWMVSDLMTRVARLDHLDGKLHILNQLSDNELKALYEGCWFTIYPSFAEGWGLPVAESLVFGKPCLAAHTTSIPEVGGDFVWYIDPLNVTEGVDAVTALIANPERVEAAAQRIRQDFKPRTWADVATNLMSGFTALKTLPRKGSVSFDMNLSPGIVYRVGGKRDKANPVSARERATLDLMFDDGWYGAESWGRWLKGQSGNLHIARPEDQGAGRHLLYFKLQAVDFWRGQRLLLTCPQAEQEVTLLPLAGARGDFYTRMTLPPGPVDLTFEVDRLDVGGGADDRPLSIGIIAFGIAAVADIEACGTLREDQDNGMPVAIADAYRMGTAPPIALFKVSPRAQWLTHIVKRATHESPAKTAWRVARRIKLHLVG
jgi:glycosyltransferase involved in cell wall biosynthesis